MASANMKDIKRRIKSVESTMQITKAMELVASSKLRKAKDKADRARPFFNAIYDTMCELSGGASDLSSPFTRPRKIKTTLLIVIAGDRGLAGGFNSNILKMAHEKANEIEHSGGNAKILPIGKKSTEYYEKRGFDIFEKYSGIAETLGIYDADAISGKIVSDFESGEIDKIELYYTTFVSALVQLPKCMDILPFKAEKKTGSPSQVTIYDPSAEAVFDSLVPKYITGIIYGAIIDSFASEQAARRIAMESASDNAGDMIDNLSLIYNRARQATITQEITEIVGGAKAQN